MKEQIVITLEITNDGLYFGNMIGKVGKRETDSIKSYVVPNSAGALLNFFEYQLPKVKQWMEQIR